MSEDVKITADLCVVDLPDDRKVKVGVGYRSDNNERVGMALMFENKGEVTKLCLTDEAFDAMVKLASLARRKERKRVFAWTVAGQFGEGVWTVKQQ
jgi:hypothetical protein